MMMRYKRKPHLVYHHTDLAKDKRNPEIHIAKSCSPSKEVKPAKVHEEVYSDSDFEDADEEQPQPVKAVSKPKNLLSIGKVQNGIIPGPIQTCQKSEQEVVPTPRIDMKQVEAHTVTSTLPTSSQRPKIIEQKYRMMKQETVIKHNDFVQK